MEMIKKIGDKRGISPVVATVLLITIALVVIAIIWIWASRSIQDKETKFGTQLSQACAKLNIDVSISEGNVEVVNNENQFALEDLILKDTSGDLHRCGLGPVSPGDSKSATILSCEGISADDVKSIIPVLKGDDDVIYNCDNDEITNF